MKARKNTSPSHQFDRDRPPPEARREAVADTLEEMRAENLRRRSTFEAHRAHIEVESYRDGRDDFRALYNPPEDRTRAEHAGHLHNISPDARDTYERGATVYGDVLVIPREPAGKAASADRVRAGSHAHAFVEFAPLVGEGRAKEVAAEFVELGRAIAGRAGDGDTRLVVFRTFYNEISLDTATGKFRSREEQAAQIEPTLERMRVLAEAMRATEWKRDRAEFVEFGDWERGYEDRQRDAEREAHGRLTYRIENIPGLEPERDEFEEQTRERAEDEREEIGGRVPNVEYERVRLSGLPPRLPDGLTEEDERRLHYEIVPRIDRQLEHGARPRDITGWLTTSQRAESERSRDEDAARLMLARSPDANREHPLARGEELRALYTLLTLSGDRDRGKVVEEIARLTPTERERAEAIEAVGSRLAQEYRRTTARLNAYEAAEAERERLTGETLLYESARRASAEFQQTLQQEREQERDRAVTEREALIRSNHARYRNGEPQTLIPAHPELTGETRPLSPYAQLHQAHTEDRRQARGHLAEQLINTDIEQARSANLAEIEGHREHFRRVTGREVMSAQETRGTLEPQLKRQRATLDRLGAERSQIEVERSRPREKFFNPIFVGLGDGRLRLPVENFNEHQTLTKLAGKLKLGARIYESQSGREVTGERAERDAAYTFARDYVSYRAQDDVTRLRNEKRLFREYAARLDRARSTDELRASVNDIRRDNYKRATQSEHFADESHEAVSRNEQPRRPLTTVEMRKLFLAPAPEHYTAEMREIRLSRAESGRDRTERIRNLERGGREPSPALAALLKEFDRTRHDSPERHSRNIRLFLGDYLNPPAPDKNRFSPENLHELGKRLEPAERDYFFRLVDSTRHALTAGVPVREIAPDGRQAHTHQTDARSHQPAGASAQELAPPARAPRDSTSFRLYYGAATWREAEQIAAALRRNVEEKPFGVERETVVRGFRDHDLETVAALLVEFASKPERIDAAASHLRSSEERERRQLGEILQTFRAMEVSHDPEEGQLRFQITTPANSELGRAEWERLLDHLPPRVGASRGARLPEAQRGQITRAALDLAWQDVEARGKQYTELTPGKSASGKTGGLREAIERGINSQNRARTAANALEQATAHDQSKRTPLVAYAARTKAEYLNSFRAIDEQMDALALRAQNDRAFARKEAFRPVRDEMEMKVAAYLTGVVRTRGEAALEREAAYHTNAVSRVIQETLQENGYDLAALNIDEDRINAVTGKLVRELPGALRESREQTRAHEHQLTDIARRDQSSPNQEMERAATAALYAQMSHGHGNSTSPRRAEHLHQPDDEFVEQKVNRTIGQIQEQALSLTPTSNSLEPHHYLAQHKMAAHAHDADTREQHAHRSVLTR